MTWDRVYFKIEFFSLTPQSHKKEKGQRKGQGPCPLAAIAALLLESSPTPRAERKSKLLSRCTAEIQRVDLRELCCHAFRIQF